MRLSVRLSLAALLFAFASAAVAQDYPSRTVTIIVPYPAGGPTDQLARVLAPKFSEKLGQNFIVENISGGGTTIATGRVARAAKDGHTLLLHNLQISANVALYPKLTFDTEKDLAPISFINQNPLVLVGRKSLAANTLPELFAAMKKSPMRVAHPGTGATGHLATSLLAQEAKVEVVGVPYRGAAPALQDITGGHVDLFFATPQSVVQSVASGQMKAYGITSKATSPQFPGVASFVDALGPKLEIFYWHALFAPAGTPKAVIDLLNSKVNIALAQAEVKENFLRVGNEPVGGGPDVLAAKVRAELEKWKPIVRDKNIRIDQ